MMTKLQLFCLLSILIFKSTNASPINEKARSNFDKSWLAKFSDPVDDDDNLLRKLFMSKSSIPSSLHSFSGNSIDNQMTDGQSSIKLDPHFREEINRLANRINGRPMRQHQTIKNSALLNAHVDSYYPKCDSSNEQNDETKLSYLPLYYDLLNSISINNPDTTILKSNLRVYLKRSSSGSGNACECKSDNQLTLSLYEVLSKVTFLPFKEVSEKRSIESIKFDRCCDRMITFDLTELVKKWKLYPDSNNGLLLEVIDNEGNKLNVNDYIQTMNCSDKTPALPYFKLIRPDLLDLPDSTESLLRFTTYPTLDVAYNRKNNLFIPRKKNSRQLDDREDKDA